VNIPDNVNVLGFDISVVYEENLERDFGATGQWRPSLLQILNRQ